MKKYEKKKKLDKRNVREVPKQTFVNMPLGLINCNINFFKKLLTVFLITSHLDMRTCLPCSYDSV